MMAEQSIARVEPVRSDAYYDFFQMLTGVSLVAFMWTHMILVASVNLDLGGGRVMNWIAHLFEATYMAQIGGPMIALVMITHFVLAARKLPFRAREQKEMWRHTVRFNHLDTWLWIIQAVTAFIILIMGCIHMWTVLTSLPITAAKSAWRIQGGWWLLFYIILLPMIELHVGIGIYRIGVKWGWIKRSNRKVLHGFENKLTLVMIGIGILSLFTFYFLVKAQPM
jgi:fumarate reductase subunit C